MTVGVEIKNDWGSTIIDANYQPFQLVAKGTSETAFMQQKDGTDWYGLQFQTFTTTTAGGVPLIAVYSEAGHIGIARHFANTETAETKDYYVQFVSRSPSSNPVPFTWYQFDMVKTVAQSLPNYGLQIFDAAGQTVYHSSIIPVRAAGVVYIGNSSNWPSGTVSYGGTRKYAICTGKGIGYNDPAQQADNYWARILVGKMSPGQISYSSGLFEDVPFYYQGANAQNGMLIIVDVTEL